MEPIRPNQDITPGRPQQPGLARTPGAVPRRPLVNDFGPRPVRPHSAQAAQPTAPKPVAAQPLAPKQPVAAPHSRPTQATPASASALHPYIAAEPAAPSEFGGDIEEDTPQTRKKRNLSWLVGLGLFVVLSAVLLAPFLPGKVLQNFPGSSVSFATGEQTISCVGDMSPLKTTTQYKSKAGFPIVYTFSSSSTLSATCNGKPQTATGGQSSQFNPLGGLVDILCALVVAVVFAVVWRKLASRKR